MTQIFIFGASITYGVGGEHGGWADLLKLALHQKMYGDHGSGERYEVYIFAKPGATTDFILGNYEDQLAQYYKGGKSIAIVSVGLNDSRAKNDPHNYVSTVKDYESTMRRLLKGLRERADVVIALGYPAVDEAKTAPKPSPSGGTTYFWNERITEFNSAYQAICEKLEIQFIGVDVPADEWRSRYLYADGLHPNSAGHEVLYRQVWAALEAQL